MAQGSAVKKVDAVLTRLLQEHPLKYRRGLGVIYAVLIVWNLWDVVHRDILWGVNLFSAIVCAGFWAVLAWVWRRQDQCTEVARLVVEDQGDPGLKNFIWLWAYGRASWERREIISWLSEHRLSSRHPDDMSGSVRGLTQILAALRTT